MVGRVRPLVPEILG